MSWRREKIDKYQAVINVFEGSKTFDFFGLIVSTFSRLGVMVGGCGLRLGNHLRYFIWRTWD